MKSKDEIQEEIKVLKEQIEAKWDYSLGESLTYEHERSYRAWIDALKWVLGKEQP